MAKRITIPTNVAEMEEMMNNQELVGELMKEGRFQELISAYTKATDERGDLAQMVADQLKVVMAGEEQITARVTKSVEETVAKVFTSHGITRPPLGDPAPPSTGAQMNALYNPLALGVKMNDLGFANLGDFARNVWHRNPRPDNGRLDKMRAVMNDFSSIEPSAGGFLIPETMRAEIMQLELESSIVRPRATVITMSSLTQLMPFVDATTNVGSVMGGFVFYWTPEAGDINITQAKFGRTKLEAHKLTGAAAVPNELWADAPALSSWLMQTLPRGIAFYEDVAFLTGSGIGEPLGVLNSPARIVVTKEAGQPANTIVVENILNMYSRMLPSSLGRAVWLVNQSTFAQLMTMSISVGTGGAPVALMDIRSGPLTTMLGRPVVITEKVPALSSESDVNFIDFDYYLIGDRQAVSIETSEHARFLTDETLLRVIERVDGRPWIQSAFTPLNGSTVSPFVSLGAR